MEKIRLATTDLHVTPICFGTWEIGGMPFFQTLDKEEMIRTVHTVLDIGINFIDTAPVYGFGRSESILGEALKGREVILATKCGLYWKDQDIDSINVNNSPSFIKQNLEESLSRLKRETIDLFQIHWPEFDKKTPLCETIAILEKLKQEGKIRYYGVSNFSIDQLEEVINYGAISTVQNRYSILMGDIVELEFCKKHGIAFMAYSPLHRGLLSNNYRYDLASSDDPMVKKISEEKDYQSYRIIAGKLNELAIRSDVTLSNMVLNYMINYKDVSVAIVGSKNRNHIEELKHVLDSNIEANEVGDLL